MNILIRMGFLLFAVTSMPSASAQTSGGTLDKVKERGVISLGVRESALPFSYLDDNHQPIGYSVDLCLRVVESIKSHLEMPDLKVKTVPVASSSRIPLMANGTIDLECGTTSNTADRQKQVGFSVTTFIAGTRFISKKENNLRSLESLRGKKVVATAGSSNLRQISDLNTSKNLGINIAAVKDFGEGFLMVETNRAAAFFLDDITLAGLAAASKNPTDYVISAESLSVEPYAIMVRKDDDAFRKLVNDSLTSLYKSGEIRRIYHKWFQSPVPPKGIAMNVPVSAPLEKAFAQPTDSPHPSDY